MFADGEVVGVGRDRGTGSIGRSPHTVAAAAAPGSKVYWLLSADDKVAARHGAVSYGSVQEGRDRVAVGIAPTGDGRGYWVATSSGRIFAFGDARKWRLVAPALRSGEHVVSLSASPYRDGYWEGTSVGRLLAPRSVHRPGSVTPLGSGHPVVAVVAAPRGSGYWVLGADGEVLALAGERAYGGATAVSRRGPVPGSGTAGKRAALYRAVGLVPSPGGSGYWIALSDGAVLALGRAPHLAALLPLRRRGSATALIA
ncbi:MAG TPA: hypothetical protein VFN61_14280 [Acidimicrobiales bacterium]|nr:hypothetical protein [Acidimicrobiales bacterium]